MTRRKIWDVDHPPVVVLAGTGERLDEFEQRLGAEREYRVERLDTASAALDRLDGDSAVECLWVAEDLTDGPGLELLESATDRDPSTRIVLAPSAGSEDLAARATAAGADEYVPDHAPLEERIERLDTAVDRAIDRRHDARKRSVLDAMFTELEISMFAKDEKARHVLYADREYAPDPDEVFGRTDLDAFPYSSPGLESSYRDDLAVIEEGERIDGKVERYDDGETDWQWTKKAPWVEDGETRGLVGLTLQITEWKRRERELLHQIGRLQEIPEYVTHDLRNPLGIARGYVDLARDGDETALDTAADALDRMETLLEDFHTLATDRRESPGAERPLDLADAVEDVWQYVRMPGATLELEVPDGATIVADEGQLRPLLRNLLRNSIEHAGPHVSITVGMLSDGFYVADDGPGLGPVAETDLFREGVTTVSDGSGLGLAIVREAAHLHGWQVDATESSAGGARFEVRGSLTSRPVDVTPTGDTVGLSESTDVGNPAVPGSASVVDDADDPGTVVLEGAGENIWEFVNEFQFFHAPAPEAVRIEARVASMDAASTHSKAAVMVRSDLEPDAAYGGIGRLDGGVPEVLWRESAGRRGTSDQIGGYEGDASWLRLDRVGEEVSCAVSSDGETWELVDRRAVDLGDAPRIGLAVCSRRPDEAITARFEDVEVVRLDG